MPSETISLPEAYFLALFCEAILHGVFTVLFCGAMYLLLKRRERRATIANQVMTFTTVAMYGLSTTHIALSLKQNLIAFFEQDAASGRLTILNDPGNRLVYSQIAIETINCLVGDSIVTWRAWVLWGRGWKVLVFPAISITAGVISSVGLTMAFSVEPSGEEIFSHRIFDWIMPFFSFTFITNVYAVGVIAIKTWQHRQTMKQLERSGSRVISSSNMQTILLLLIESGFLYCLALIIIIILFVVGNNGVYVIADMVAHLTGIYPVVIIVLVILQLTQHDISTKQLTLSRMNFDAEGQATSVQLTTFRLHVDTVHSNDSSQDSRNAASHTDMKNKGIGH
ncbi:hypothetical protein ACEPAH_3981 [Sanghuangporus vaninii]